MGPLGKSRQVLANLEAHDACGFGLKFPTEFRWRFGLHIPGVLLCRTSPHEQQDARFSFSTRGWFQLLDFFASLQEFRQPESNRLRPPT
jgi:hypothetical protein